MRRISIKWKDNIYVAERTEKSRSFAIEIVEREKQGIDRQNRKEIRNKERTEKRSETKKTRYGEKIRIKVGFMIHSHILHGKPEYQLLNQWDDCISKSPWRQLVVKTG